MKKILKKLFLVVFLCLAQLPASALADAVLNVPEAFQEHSQWCWAGSADSVLRYYGNAQPQCDMANFAWGRNDCCGGPTFSWNHPCDQPNYMFGAAGSLQDILNNWGVYSTGVNSHLSQSGITTEIGTGRPFILRYGWTSGGGHFIVGRGIQGNMVYLMDPWPGEGYSIVAYSSTVSSSQHQWTHSLKTSDSTPPPVEDWKTEIGVINPDPARLRGALRGFGVAGNQIWMRAVNLGSHERLELDVTTAAGTFAPQIKSMRLDIDEGQAVGYQKFYQSGKYRVGLEASPRANQDRLLIPHIASNNTWATGIGWMNTTNEAKTLQFSFDTGQQVEKNLPAGGHEAFTISSLFAETAQPNIGAAQISNGAGIVGLVLFGSNNTLSGVNLSDATTSTLYFPDTSFDSEWLTGFSIYNPGNQAASLTLTYFNSQGNSLGTHNKVVEPNQKISGNPQTFNFPNGTTWFMAQSSQPVTGFTLIGSANSDQLGGFSVVNIAALSGVLPKLESNGWNGITFVNPGQASVNVQVQARNNAGTIVASNNLDLNSGQKWQNQAEVLFPGQDISSATYISFTASGDVVGFLLNGSADGTMLDAIPALGGSHTGTQHLYFPHIAAE